MEKILEDIKGMKGKVVCVGVKDERLLHLLSKNKEADIFTLDRVIHRSIFFSNKKVKTQDGKKINIKKLKKFFKKKSVDYMICDLNEIYDYFKFFIGNSVVVNKKTLYIYGTSKYIDPNKLAKRYKRYKASVEVISNGDNFVLVINNEHSKTNWFKDKWYLIVDTCHNIGDMISSSLIS